jgi:hypothetical protein
MFSATMAYVPLVHADADDRPKGGVAGAGARGRCWRGLWWRAALQADIAVEVEP